MEDRTRNILIGLIVLFLVLGVGAMFMQPYLNPEGGVAGPGAAEYAQARKLMEAGRFPEAQVAFFTIIQGHGGTPVAARAQADKDFGIPFHEAVRTAQAGNLPQARATLARVARGGAKTEWGPKASAELTRLSQSGGAAAPPPQPDDPAPPVGSMPPAGQDQGRQNRLTQANALLEAGRTEEARVIFQGLANEGVDDPAGAAARLQLSTLQAAGDVVRATPEVRRAHVALHRTRASLLGYRGETGQFPPTLDARGLERYGFAVPDLLAEVARVESYRAEGGARFELIVVAQDARGTRVRATDQAVEDLP